MSLNSQERSNPVYRRLPLLWTCDSVPGAGHWMVGAAYVRLFVPGSPLRNLANSEFPQFYLKPGEAQLSRRPAVLKTILGSCVGVTFWSPRLRIGALCHGILPRFPEGGDPSDGYRYVDFSIHDLTRRLDLLGATRSELEIKVFGGANMLWTRDMNSQVPTVGQSNLEAALDVLREGRFNVVGCDVGGTVGRNIRFQTWDGHVFLRRPMSDVHCKGTCRKNGQCNFLESGGEHIA